MPITYILEAINESAKQANDHNTTVNMFKILVSFFNFGCLLVIRARIPDIIIVMKKVRNIISQNSDKSFLDLAPEIIKHLTGDDISNEPFSEVIGTVGFFLKQWMTSTSNIQNLMKAVGMKNNLLQELKDSTDSEASVLTLS